MVDFGSLFLLHAIFHLSLPIAASVAYWFAVLYNFSITRLWTFSKKDYEKLYKHMFMYGLLLAINYSFTVIFVSIVSNSIYFGTAKILAVIIQTSWTFFIYKKYIFT